MRNVFKKVACLFVAVSVAATASAAMANHHGKAHRHHKKCDHRIDNSVLIPTEDKAVIREYLAQDAKDRKEAVKVKGKVKAAQRPLPDYVVYHLQPQPKGYRYVVVNHEAQLIHEPSKHVVDSVSLRD